MTDYAKVDGFELARRQVTFVLGSVFVHGISWMWKATQMHSLLVRARLPYFKTLNFCRLDTDH